MSRTKIAGWVLTLVLSVLAPAHPVRAEQLLRMEILAADIAASRATLLLRLTGKDGFQLLPEGECDSSLPDIGETATNCYKLDIVENGAPIGRYSYRILDTRGSTSFLLVTCDALRLPSSCTTRKATSVQACDWPS